MQRRPRVHWTEHLAWLRTLSCCVCGDNTLVDPAHIRMGCREIGKRPTGMGERPSDIYTVPLCRRCHDDQHRIGEKAFWSAEPHFPFLLCLALACAHGDTELAEMIIRGENE